MLVRLSWLGSRARRLWKDHSYFKIRTISEQAVTKNKFKDFTGKYSHNEQTDRNNSAEKL